MEERSVTHSTFTIERSYPRTPERVFAAFADPAKKRRWFAEGEGFVVEDFSMDFRVGGFERARFRTGEGTPIAGSVISNETRFMDIIPQRRIVLAYAMAMGDRPFSASLVTFEFVADGDTTKLKFTEQAAFFEGADGPAMREQGWRQLLEALGKELTT
jgi:uncharacterized protein YndB with AHSA1/START domain